jgi:hypothetical protein
MVAFNMSMRHAVGLVRCTRTAPERMQRFRTFALLLDIHANPAALKFFGRACGINVQYVEVTADDIANPAHPLHFLAQKMPAPPDEQP